MSKKSALPFWKFMTVMNFCLALLFKNPGSLGFALLSLTIYFILKHREEKLMESEVEQDSTSDIDKSIREQLKFQKDILIEASELITQYGEEYENDLPKSLEAIERDYGKLYRLSTLVGIFHGCIVQHGFHNLKRRGLVLVLDEAIHSIDKIKFSHPSFIVFLDMLLRFKEISKTHDKLHVSAYEVTDPTCQYLITNYAENKFLFEQCIDLDNEYILLSNDFVKGFSEWISNHREEIDGERKYHRENVAKSNIDEKVEL